jgi:hypothetical protein
MSDGQLERLERAIQQLALAIDHVAGIAAGVAAYVAHLPGADNVNPESVKSMAVSLAPQAVAQRGAAPQAHAATTVDRILSGPGRGKAPRES